MAKKKQDKPPETKGLQDVNIGTWIWANEIMSKEKKAVRKSTWPVGDFLWWRATYAKVIQENKQGGGLMWPISKRFLDSKGIDKFLISSHYDKWEEGASKIRVGWQPTGEDKAATDWEIYEV